MLLKITKVLLLSLVVAAIAAALLCMCWDVKLLDLFGILEEK